MGRSSSTGVPFLGQRENGKYLYNRDLPPDVAPLVAGEVLVEWSRKPLVLLGGAVIKRSFGTNDLNIAKKRWVGLHAQIEVIVERAIERVRTSSANRGATMVGQLDTSDIKRMAGQVTHDILAENDKAWGDPRSSSATAEVVLRLEKKAGRRFDTPAHAAARAVAEDAKLRLLKGHLAEHSASRFDQKIIEGEIDVSDEVRDRLLEFSRTGDADRRIDGRPIAALSETAKSDVFTEPTVANLIPSDVDAILLDNGIELPSDNPDRHRMALAILRAEVNAYRTVQARRNGDTTETPERPPRMAAPRPPSPKISEMQAHWKTDVGPKKKQIDDNALYLRRFIELHGDLPIDQIDSDKVIAYRDALLGCPRNPTKAMCEAPLSELILWAKVNGRRLLSRQTINSKGVGAISTLLEIAVKRKLVSVNVCADLLFPVNGSAIPRLPYDVSDLTKIFALDIYKVGKRWTAGGDEAQFWLPLIGLFEGPRLEEIGQLLGPALIFSWFHQAR